MNKPRICAVIVNNDLEAIKAVAPLVDLYEVRIDLIGNDWPKIAEQLKKPWLACNRSDEEGGSWRDSETTRVAELVKAAEMGAHIVDVELTTENIEQTVTLIKEAGAKCLISFHSLVGTPSPETLREIMQGELKAGADICKVVTTARTFADNLSVLQLINDFPQTRVVSLAMGDLGVLSRVLCPLWGGDFTYASIAEGSESAPGQITVTVLNRIYQALLGKEVL